MLLSRIRCAADALDFPGRRQLNGPKLLPHGTPEEHLATSARGSTAPGYLQTQMFIHLLTAIGEQNQFHSNNTKRENTAVLLFSS